MANQQRLRRIADQIQRELSDCCAPSSKTARRDDHAHRVEVSPDLAYAKVFFHDLGRCGSLTRIEMGLERAAGFLRAQLGNV